MAGRNVYRTVLKVKELGYCVSLYYVGLESADLAIERVRYRVTKGGHGIDEQIIRNRYIKSFENLREILPLCDNINLYDNTHDFEPVVNIKTRTIEYINDNIPLYFSDIIDYIKKIYDYKE